MGSEIHMHTRRVLHICFVDEWMTVNPRLESRVYLMRSPAIRYIPSPSIEERVALLTQLRDENDELHTEMGMYMNL
jgi:hypothetical protein